VSDGEHFIQAMLATQLNSLVKDETIKKNSIINVTKMTCNFVQDKRCVPCTKTRDALYSTVSI
jgi:replication factor A1